MLWTVPALKCDKTSELRMSYNCKQDLYSKMLTELTQKVTFVTRIGRNSV